MQLSRMQLRHMHLRHMHLRRAALVALGTASLLWTAAGCQSSEEAAHEGRKAMEPFGTEADVERAARIWSEIENYQSWSTYPGKGGWRDGTSPHGRYLKYYVNSVANQAPAEPRDGYVIVKENYPEKRSDALGPITVMKKVDGYDPDNADWFWVKFAPDGSVMESSQGTPLAGRVAKGARSGCISCHTSALGGDYLFAND